MKSRWAGWLALSALVVGALAPAFSEAVAAGRDAGWAEICSASGAQRIRLDPASPARTPTRRHPLQHCWYCSLHHATLGMPPPTIYFAAPSLRAVAVALDSREAPAVPVWNRGQPRGPPRVGLLP